MPRYPQDPSQVLCYPWAAGHCLLSVGGGGSRKAQHGKRQPSGDQKGVFATWILALNPPWVPVLSPQVLNNALTSGATRSQTGAGEGPSLLANEAALLTRQPLVSMGSGCCGRQVGSAGRSTGTALTCLCCLLSECQPVPLNGEL